MSLESCKFLLYFSHGKTKFIHIVSDIRDTKMMQASLGLSIQQSRMGNKVASERQKMSLCKIVVAWQWLNYTCDKIQTEVVLLEKGSITQTSITWKENRKKKKVKKVTEIWRIAYIHIFFSRTGKKFAQQQRQWLQPLAKGGWGLYNCLDSIFSFRAGDSYLLHTYL